MRTLRNAIEHDQVRQAYLFAGPRGTGKTSMARILAKALNAEGGPTADFDPTTRIARAIADGTALDVVEMDAASQRGHRRGARDPRAGDAPAGGGPLQGLHRRRGAPADDGRLERPAQADRGAAAAPRLRLLHDGALEGDPDRAIALPDVRLPAAAPAGDRHGAPPGLRRRGHRRPRLGALADRARRGRVVPRRDLDARPARRGDGEADLGAGRAPARDGGRGGRALPALRHDRRPRRRGRARARRGALGARPGPRPADEGAPRAPPAPAARAAPRARSRVAPAHRGVARPAPRAGEPAPRADGAAADRPSRGRRGGRAPGRRPAAPARAGARQGDAPTVRSRARIACPSGRSAGIPGACRCSRRGVVGPLPRSRARGGPGTCESRACAERGRRARDHPRADARGVDEKRAPGRARSARSRSPRCSRRRRPTASRTTRSRCRSGPEPTSTASRSTSRRT